MTTSQLHEFARMGAEARLKTIQEEQPSSEFSLSVGMGLLRPASHPLLRRGRRRRMAAAERKAVGRRMLLLGRAPGREGTVDREAEAEGRHVRGCAQAPGERKKAYWAAKGAASRRRWRRHSVQDCDGERLRQANWQGEPEAAEQVA